LVEAPPELKGNEGTTGKTGSEETEGTLRVRNKKKKYLIKKGYGRGWVLRKKEGNRGGTFIRVSDSERQG